MSDTPFIVSVRYREVTQPQQYHSQEAEVSAQFTVAEGTDADTAIQSGLSMVKRQVLIALGKVAGTLIAVATDPEKRGRGRPPKEKPVETVQSAEQVKPAAEATSASAEPATVAETTAPSAQSSDDDFGDTTEAPAKEITDAEVQEECRKTVHLGKGKVTAADVKDMAYRRYGTNKVVAIKQEDREKFLADLKTLLAEKSAK